MLQKYVYYLPNIQLHFNVKQLKTGITIGILQLFV